MMEEPTINSIRYSTIVCSNPKKLCMKRLQDILILFAKNFAKFSLIYKEISMHSLPSAPLLILLEDYLLEPGTKFEILITKNINSWSPP